MPSFVMPATGEFYLQAARGRLEGVIPVHKFGLATDIDTADGEVDIWDGVRTGLPSKITPYNWIDTPTDLQVSSTSVNDVGVELMGEGLDENWNIASGSLTLNGQTPVQVGQLRRRIHRGWVSGSQAAEGIIYVSDLGTATVGGVPSDSTKVRLIIHPDSQQTQMALYTVPAGYDLYIVNAWCNIAREIVATGQAGIRIYRREQGGVFRTVHTLSISVGGSSGDHRPYTVPIRFKEKEDLIYRATASTNDLGVSAGFHGLLIKR